MTTLRNIGLAAAATAVLAGCETAQVRMPAGFAPDAAAYEVSGHSPRRFGEPVRFGPYSALDMRDGGTFSWAIPVGRVDVGRAARHFAYTLVAPAQPPVEVQCRARTWTASHGDPDQLLEVDLTALAGPMLACGLWLDGTAQALPLDLSRNGTRLHGRLDSPWGGYQLRSVHGYAGSSWPAAEPTGFEVLRDGAPLMMVDMLNAGRVHLDPRLGDEERVYLAAAAAALLLVGEEIAL